MPKFISYTVSGGHKYVRVCSNSRDSDGNPRPKHLESHGNLEKLLAKDPKYLINLQKRLDEENELERKTKLKALEDEAQERIKKMKVLLQGKEDYNGAKLLHLGIALLYRVWAEDLNMPKLFYYLKNKSKIDYSYNDAAFFLCSQRILRPASKKKSFENRDKDIMPSSIEDINVVYRVLNRLSKDKLTIVRHINREINKKLERDISVAFYDVTTYAFESRMADGLREFGLSKDHKVNEVQVVLGLVMDKNGIPIDYDLFSGNTSEFGTLLPMIKRVKKDYGLKKLTVVADRGLNSNENLVNLKKLGCDFVIAQKIRNCTEEQKGLILANDNWEKAIVDNDGEVLCRYKKLDIKKPIYKTSISPKTGRKTQSSKATETLDVRWIVSYSHARAKNDLDDLDRAVEKAQKLIQSRSSLATSHGYKALITVPKGQGKPELNEAKIADARRWAGYYAVCTNLTTETSEEIMAMYRNLWKIEDCFRVSKTTLEARPCFVWNPDRIKGHFLSCFISLVIEKYLLYVLKEKIGNITTDQINNALRKACVVYDNTNVESAIYIKLDEEAKRFDEMLEAFSLEKLTLHETAAGIQKKLKLPSVYRGETRT